VDESVSTAPLINALRGRSSAQEVAVLDLNARLTATQGAAYAGVTPQAIVNWRRRGHLEPDGYDDSGRPLYTLLALARAEYATRKRARRTG
jgi:hypothetical protein